MGASLIEISILEFKAPVSITDELPSNTRISPLINLALGVIVTSFLA